MTTVVLVVLCVMVGALELHAGRRSKQQYDAFVRHLDSLNDQVSRQNTEMSLSGEQLTAELARVKRDVLPALDARLRDTGGEVRELASLVHRADAFVRAQSTRLQELEQQRITLAALRRKLAEVESAVHTARPETVPPGGVGPAVDTALDRLADLERGGAEIWDLQRTLARTLEEVEDTVAELLQLTESGLDDAVTSALTGRTPGRTAVRATGRLWTRDEPLHDVLTEVYERTVTASRLEVRFRTAEGGGRRYFLGGREIGDLDGAFTALLISTGTDLQRGVHHDPRRLDRALTVAPLPPGDEAAFKGLLRVLFESTGAIAQIGPLLCVRTREELLCAILNPDQVLALEHEEVLWDPSDTALRLRRMPPHQVWDLTGWAEVT